MKGRQFRFLKLGVVVSFLISAPAYLLVERAAYANAPAQTAQKNPLKPTETNIALGLDHFQAHCASCHGSSGKADIEKSKTIGAADLTSAEIQSKSDAELFQIISKGVPGTAMPAFAGTHTATEIWQSILFVRKLPTLTPDERAKLEAAIPAGARHRHGSGEQPHEHPDKPQQQAGHQHDPQTPTQPGEMKHDMSKMGNEPGTMSDMHAGHDMDATMATITGGPFRSMSAIGSGTSLMPPSAPEYMWHGVRDDWMIMAHFDVRLGFNHQGGPRGVNKAESQNWLMLMAERQAGPGRLMLRGMVSAEPATAPKRGFPELLQTGETFRGRPIIDAQHPHDLFMEIAAAYNIQLSENLALNFYGGPVGEPALGPVAFMHRMSAAENPAAPLGHHWQDSTHISHGVITAGVTAGLFRIESSLFRGAEPDEGRKDIEVGKLDSWSGRIWFTPTPDWSMQLSYGHLVHPEAAEPGNLKRVTASISHNRSWSDGNWATSLIWGRNRELHGVSNAYLFESTANFLDKNYLYTRMELVDKNGLLEENIFGRPGLDRSLSPGSGLNLGTLFDDSFRVGAFTFGGVRDLVANAKMRVGIGGDATFYHVPDSLKSIYGSSPASFHVFVRIRPGKK